MKIELDAGENALLISALTCKISKLKEQRELFVVDGMLHWVSDVDSEILFCEALKDRLFK